MAGFSRIAGLRVSQWNQKYHGRVHFASRLQSRGHYKVPRCQAAILARTPGEYRWSGARAHLEGKDDLLVKVEPMLSQIGDWSGYLALDEDEAELAALRLHQRTGRPLGNADFIAGVEEVMGRFLRRRKPGPKAKKKVN